MYKILQNFIEKYKIIAENALLTRGFSLAILTESPKYYLLIKKE